MGILDPLKELWFQIKYGRPELGIKLVVYTRYEHIPIPTIYPARYIKKTSVTPDGTGIKRMIQYRLGYKLIDMPNITYPNINLHEEKQILQVLKVSTNYYLPLIFEEGKQVYKIPKYVTDDNGVPKKFKIAKDCDADGNPIFERDEAGQLIEDIAGEPYLEGFTNGTLLDTDFALKNGKVTNIPHAIATDSLDWEKFLADEVMDANRMTQNPNPGIQQYLPIIGGILVMIIATVFAYILYQKFEDVSRVFVELAKLQTTNNAQMTQAVNAVTQACHVVSPTPIKPPV